MTERVTANGLELAYEAFGSPDDPPLLLVMGLGTQMIGWRDGFCRLLAGRGFRVIRFDNRDVGESTHLDGLRVPKPVGVLLGRDQVAYSIEDMAADTLGLMDALGLERVHLVSASMGGFISQHVALAQPERVASLALFMTSTGARRVGGTHPKVIAALLRRKPATSREEAIETSWKLLQLTQSPAYPWAEDDVRAQVGLAYDRGYDADGGGRQFAAVVGQTDRTAALADLRIPTVMLHGLADRMVNFSGGVALARAIPGSRLVGYHGMGHDLPPALWPDFVAEIVANSRRDVPHPEPAAAPGQTSLEPEVSSGGLVVAVRPGGCLVVRGAGLEAAVEDADESVADLPQRGVVADVAAAELVVVGADLAVVQDRARRLHMQRVEEPIVVHEPGRHDPHLPGLAGDRAGPCVVLPGFRAGVAAGRVAELGEHPGAEDLPDARLAEDDLSVRVPTKMGLYLLLEEADLCVQGGQDRYQRPHRHRVRRGYRGGLAQLLRTARPVGSQRL